MSGNSIADLSELLQEIAAMDRAACATALADLPDLRMPSRLRAETLRRVLAYETQVRAFGGLTGSEMRCLRSIASGKTVGDVSTRTFPGTHLIREWNGRTYRVEVTEAGYVFDGTIYRSLSAVAKRITGTAWSGPRFFGLTAKRSA